MSKSHLLKYLLISPNLPVGGFCYSEGMESYLQHKNFTDSNSVKELIISELEIGQIRLDGKLLLDFFDIFSELNQGKNLKFNLHKLLSLDKWILSSKDSVEMREQQTQMAKSLFDLTKEFGFEYLHKKNKKNSWPLAWSWACYCFEITKIVMVENFFYAWSANQLSAALRIIPIGSTKAQLIQRDLLEIILQLPREGKLNDGDILLTNESNFYVEIIAKTENLIEISSKSKIELIKTAYHLGNRHVEVEIEEDILLTKSDYVIENMLKNFNVDIVNTQKKFFPERGAHSHE